MSMYGAIPDQLTGLGTTLRNQIEPINGLVSTVTNALGTTTWTGPARDKFEEDWNTTFKSALDGLAKAFDAAGNDCVNRSTELQQVMGRR